MSLRRRLGLIALADEAGPLFAVYTLLLVDNGLSVSQISAVFILWAAFEIVAEVPTGVLADRVSRRLLLLVAVALRAAGIALWLLDGSFAAAMAGALLWALHAALASGAWEALVYDALAERGESARYGALMARLSQLSNLGVAAATVLATIALASGASLHSVGWATVALHLVPLALLAGLPSPAAPSALDDPDTDDASDDASDADDAALSYAAWAHELRVGARQALTQVGVLRILVVTALIEGLFVVDEYVAVLARARNAADSFVPIVTGVIWLGLLGGAEAAARWPGRAQRRDAAALLVGAVGVLAAVTLAHRAALLLIAVGYAAMEAARVTGDARFQDQIPSAHRATLTSVRSFAAALVTLAALAAIGLTSRAGDPTIGLTLVAAALSLTAVAHLRTPQRSSPAPIGR